MPELNIHPWRPALRFGNGQPEAALYARTARNLAELGVFDLVNVRHNGFAVPASASDELEANGIVAQILTTNRFKWSRKVLGWAVIEGAPTGSEVQYLYLGEDGGFTLDAPNPTDGIVQVVGMLGDYRQSDGKHYVIMDLDMVVETEPRKRVVNTSGGTMLANHIYGRNPATGNFAAAQSGATPIPPYVLVMVDTPNGEQAPYLTHEFAVKVQAEVSGTYVMGAPAYLSGTAAGKVTRIRPAGARWIVGRFAETARDGNEQILVDLQIDPMVVQS